MIAVCCENRNKNTNSVGKTPNFVLKQVVHVEQWGPKG
jgi:hypothetical protein